MPDKDVAGPTSGQLGATFQSLTGGHDWKVDAEEQLPDQRVDGPSPAPQVAAIEVEQASRTSPGRTSQGAGNETPPSVTQIVEALLFAGGPPLKPERAAEIVRGLTPEQFHECIDALNRRYRSQNRPYAVITCEHGYRLDLKARYRSVREKLLGGPRAARLAQPALDVLALVAYRQPVARAELDSLRGADSIAQLRQLVRLGLVAVTQRGDSGQHDVHYGTTPHFLEVFGLRSLDDLPRTSDPQRL